MSGALIAVFDVGKTNAKIAFVDPATGQEIWSARRANEIERNHDARAIRPRFVGHAYNPPPRAEPCPADMRTHRVNAAPI